MTRITVHIKTKTADLTERVKKYFANSHAFTTFSSIAHHQMNMTKKINFNIQ
jgi:hypothetical protein